MKGMEGGRGVGTSPLRGALALLALLRQYRQSDPELAGVLLRGSIEIPC